MKIFNLTKARLIKASKISIVLGLVAAGTYMILDAFNDNIIFFYTPSELIEKNIDPSEKKILRIGGYVADGSIKKLTDIKIAFVMTDFSRDITVEYDGLTPNLFKEGQGAIAFGTLVSKDKFIATQLLAKHDETYKPREIEHIKPKNISQ